MFMEADKKAIADTWRQAKLKKYIFPAIAGCDSYDFRRIHPLKQRAVYCIYEALKDNRYVEGMILFGSSVTVCCNRNSDIDLAVELRSDCLTNEARNEVSEIIQNACGYGADIIWTDHIKENSAIDANIKRGVRLI